MTHKLYPCLWFDGTAKDAANLYCEVFPNSKIMSDNPMVCDFELDGQKFIGLNGGPHFTPNPSISFFVLYESVDELNTAWDKLSDGGIVMMALDKYDWSDRYGWLTDKFGISWQLYLGKMEHVGQRFTTSFMFTEQVAGRAEEAIHCYTSIFKDASVGGIMKYNAGEGDVEGHVKHSQFTLNNQVFMAMDSSMAHQFTFNEGISIVVPCDTQEEIDYYWNKLTADGGKESQCGWLKDKFGVSWQIIPAILQELMSDPQRSQRVVQAFMKMKKFDIQALLNA